MASRRRVGAVAARKAAADAVFMQRAKSFIALLRRQAGISVRQPAHAVAPFRSVPLNWWAITQHDADDAGKDTLDTRRTPINWLPEFVEPISGSASPTDTLYGASNGVDAYENPSSTEYGTGSPFPDGYLGFVTSINCWVQIHTANPIDIPPMRSLRWSWSIDGQTVPGYKNALPAQEALPLAGGFGVASVLYPGMGQTASQLGCPVQVRPGQRSYVESSMFIPSGAGNYKKLVVFRLGGYMVPTKTDDGTIFGTITD